MAKPKLYVCTKHKHPDCPSHSQISNRCPHEFPHEVNMDKYDFRKLGECWIGSGRCLHVKCVRAGQGEEGQGGARRGKARK